MSKGFKASSEERSSSGNQREIMSGHSRIAKIIKQLMWWIGVVLIELIGFGLFLLREIITLTVIIALIAFLVFTVVIAVSLIRIPYNENRAYDVLGSLSVKGPGLHLIVPYIYKYIETTPVSGMQTTISLFSVDDWLNCKGGGKVNFGDNLVLFYRYKEARGIILAFKRARDHVDKIKSEAQNAIRAMINTTALDELLPSGMSKKETKKNLGTLFFDAVNESSKLKDFLEIDIENQIEITSVTLGDYNIDKESEDKRRESFDAQVNVEIAEKKAEAVEKEIGGGLSGIREKLATSGFSKDKIDETATNTFRDKMAGSSLSRDTHEINWNNKGGGNSENSMFSPEQIVKLKTAFGLEFGKNGKSDKDKETGEDEIEDIEKIVKKYRELRK